MSVTIIAAIDKNGCIGKNGDLPWRLPRDLRRFKRLTTPHIVVMGRKTWDSLPRPLPGRTNWVLSRTPHAIKRRDGHRLFNSVEELLEAKGNSRIYVIGGADIYAEFLPMADKMHLTLVNTEVEGGDTFFPDFDSGQWTGLAKFNYPRDSEHAFEYSFLDLERKLPAASASISA